MRKFSMGTFSTTWDFVKPRCSKILDKLSYFPWHFFRFNLWRKLFYAERRSSPASAVGTAVNCVIVTCHCAQMQRMVRPKTACIILLILSITRLLQA
jgi:hypothetical protein